MTRTLTIATALCFVTLTAGAQDPAEVWQLFDAGEYQQVIEAGQSPQATPSTIYAAAQSYQKIGDDNLALETYGRLAERPEGDPWRLIGLSAQHLINGQNTPSRDAATQAATTAPTLPYAHYQLGLVRAKLQNWAGAAEAFDRAVQLAPGFAYAYYYGGLSHYRANRPDRMAVQFDVFLKLAPDAPERPEVLQIMRTVRGR